MTLSATSGDRVARARRPVALSVKIRKVAASARAASRSVLTSALELAGAAAITVGVSLVSVPIAWMVGGVFGIVLGFLLGEPR